MLCFIGAGQAKPDDSAHAVVLTGVEGRFEKNEVAENIELRFASRFTEKLARYVVQTVFAPPALVARLWLPIHPAIDFS